jgi:CRISPR-associated protein Cmr6
MPYKGKVKFYNEKKDFGFIERERSRDVHFDKSSIIGSIPTKGDDVEFDIVNQSKGPHAINLKIFSEGLSAEHYKVPSDTRKIVNSDKIENQSLRFNKFPLLTKVNNKEKFIFYEANGKSNIRFNFDRVYIDFIINKYVDNITKLNFETVNVKLKTTWRMVVGLGNASVYETSMTLHHIYGIPYIPGSSLKGVLRNYIMTEKFCKGIKSEEIERKAHQDQGFCDIFGCPRESFYQKAKKGNVVFFDAFPVSKPEIIPDVMTPHYKDYYSDASGEIPPGDYDSPNPIYFLTVRNTEFLFILGIKKENNIEIQKGKLAGKTALSAAEELLNIGLSSQGIGAKRAVGYGYMEKFFPI